MSWLSHNKGLKIILGVVLAVPICLVLAYVAMTVFALSFTLIQLLALVASLFLPVLGAICLVWFVYRLFLRPYLRLRRIRLIRERRAWAAAASREASRRV